MQSFRYANKLLPTHVMKQLYYSHIFPHLIGEITIWGTDDSSKTYLQPLIRTHKHIIRLIMNRSPRTHTSPLMDNSTSSTSQTFIFTESMQIHPFHPQSQLNRPEHNNHQLWTAQVHEYPTRYSLQRHQYVPNPRAHKFSTTKRPAHETSHFSSIQLTIWNSIPEDIRSLTSRHVFKRKLKEHLMDKQTFAL